MLEILGFVLGAAAVVVAVQKVANLRGLPGAALLTLAGLVYALLPGPNLSLDPQVVLTFIIPPLLYGAALESSLTAIRANLVPIASLSVALVLATAMLIGVGFDLFVPGVGLAAGLALGAAVAPPDPVAALAVARRAGLSSRLVTLIEGEGLLNDATALTVLTVASAALVSGHFSAGFAAADFALASVGGTLAGLLVGWLARRIRRLVDDPVLEAVASLVTPFGAYALGATLHVSSVLAVVVTGLVVGHTTPRESTAPSRLQSRAVWALAGFLLEAFVFIVIGQQLPSVIAGLQAYSAGTVVIAAAVTLGVVLLLRPLWLLGTQWLPQKLAKRRASGPFASSALSGRESVALSWAGTRGVLSLTSILVLPLVLGDGEPFAGRNLLLFCAYLTVVVTLLGQGLTFGALAGRLHLPSDERVLARGRAAARAAALERALARFDAVVAREQLTGEAADHLRLELMARRARARSDTQARRQRSRSIERTAFRKAHARLLDVQRRELLRLRRAGALPDESLRILQAELDHEQHALAD